MDARAALNRSVSTGLRLGRGTADRVVRLAGPTLGKVTETVIARVRRSEPPGPTTFTPSKRPATPASEPAPAKDAGPSPASVARNIGPPRPAAAPARKRPAPKSVPGAKLPPRRPSTT